MYSKHCLCSFFVAGACTGFSSKPGHTKTIQCEFYNDTSCQETDGRNCYSVETCGQPEHEKRNHCFALWKYNASGEFIQLKGCFVNNIDCYDQMECVEKREEPKKNLLFCCCEGDMCNRNFTWDPVPSQPPTIPSKV